MANKKKQFDQEFKQNAVNYCLTHPELSRKEWQSIFIPKFIFQINEFFF